MSSTSRPRRAVVDVKIHAFRYMAWMFDIGPRVFVLVYVDVVIAWGEIVGYLDLGIHAWGAVNEDMASGIIYPYPGTVDIRR